jgi:hypothetical protein
VSYLRFPFSPKRTHLCFHQREHPITPHQNTQYKFLSINSTTLNHTRLSGFPPSSQRSNQLRLPLKHHLQHIGLNFASFTPEPSTSPKCQPHRRSFVRPIGKSNRTSFYQTNTGTKCTVFPKTSAGPNPYRVRIPVLN